MSVSLLDNLRLQMHSVSGAADVGVSAEESICFDFQFSTLERADPMSHGNEGSIRVIPGAALPRTTYKPCIVV